MAAEPAGPGAGPGAQSAGARAKRPTGRTEAFIGGAFALATVAALALIAVYWAGGQVQAEGVLLAVALGGVAVGLGTWAHRGMPGGRQVDERKPLASTPPERAAFRADFEQGEAILARRGLLLGMLGASVGAIGLAALAPIRSLGQRPAGQLRHTAWQPGSRVVTEDGRVVAARDLAVGGLLTVFPEGAGNPADSQTVLIRVEEGILRARPGREGWAPSGIVGYSKVCTHAGCPVGLYDARAHQLLCPCHQSLFDVLDGARPVFGPATRSLPQLPLAVDADGTLRARSDYTEPVGPGYWDRDR